MIRIIHYSNETGSREGVTFTEDMEADASEYVPYGCVLVSDTKAVVKLPATFPTEHQLEKV